MAQKLKFSRFVKGLTLSAALLGGPLAWANESVDPAEGVTYPISRPSQRLEMITNSSRILAVEKRVPRYQVQNESVVRAYPIGPNQIQLSAISPGVTQLNLWDTDDTLYTVDVIVAGDGRQLELLLESQFPMANLKVTPLPQGAIISGTVANAEELNKIQQIAEQFYPNVINNIVVVGVQTVLLHTKIMEVSRTKLRALGIDWSFTSSDFNISSNIGNLVREQATTGGLSIISGSSQFDANFRALRQNNLVKVLAEPTLVAQHGRPATFTVGGELPIPMITQTNFGVQYKRYGTTVDFVPFVVGPGRIRLEVRPEVSDVDPSRSVQGIPGLVTRFLETAVELNAGQTLALGGLLQLRLEAETREVPVLGELPYFGTFFRRIEERQNEVELLVMVTPQFVDGLDPHQVPPGGPGYESCSPDDCELYLKGYLEVPCVNGACGANGCGPGGGPQGSTDEQAINGLPPMAGSEPEAISLGDTATP
jgi:pilus assembly protein CpaC